MGFFYSLIMTHTFEVWVITFFIKNYAIIKKCLIATSIIVCERGDFLLEV